MAATLREIATAAAMPKKEIHINTSTFRFGGERPDRMGCSS
jgi:hypothetical protein